MYYFVFIKPINFKLAAHSSIRMWTQKHAYNAMGTIVQEKSWKSTTTRILFNKITQLAQDLQDLDPLQELLLVGQVQ